MAFEQVTLHTTEGQEYGPVSMEMMIQWHQQCRVPKGALLIDHATGESRAVASFPALSVPPPFVLDVASPGPSAVAAPSGFDHIIPMKNPKSLVAYYCGVFGIPCWILGPIALIFGILGLKDAASLGVGRGHCWAGIILGCLESLAILSLIVLLIVSMSQGI